MVLNYIWIAFFVIAFVIALITFITTGNSAIFEQIMKASFEMAETSVMKIALPLTGIMTLWLGLMNIGEKAGAIGFLSKIIGPFFSKLFPGIPSNHPAMGNILMNFSANMLGLDNAATPLGLKAMQSMQDLNTDKETASNAQIMFLVLNTSGLTLIPISIMAYRAQLGAVAPSDIFIPVLLATYCSTLTGLIAVSIKQKINLFNKTLLIGILLVTAFVGIIAWYFHQLTPDQSAVRSSFIGNFLLLSIIISFISAGLIKKINVYDAFIEGAKNGFETTVKIIPYLVGILVGIAVFRASGAMNYIVDGIAKGVSILGMPNEWVGALPTGLMKPLSGSGARGMMIDAMNTYGADSFVGRLSSIIQGSADTTFYIVALYFGSVGIRKTRYAVGYGLLTDLIGFIAAVFVAYLFF